MPKTSTYQPGDAQWSQAAMSATFLLSNISPQDPSYYYKATLDYNHPETKTIGFFVPNRKPACPLSHYAVSIDSLESLTGLDFYPLLPDGQEQDLEFHVEISLWDFNTASDQSIPCDVPSNITSMHSKFMKILLSLDN